MIRIDLDSNAQRVLAQVRQFPPLMVRAVAAAMNRENALTVGHIMKDKLSQRGPKTLGVKSNRLRGSVRWSKAVITGDGIESAIGTNVKPYPAVHEFGFDGEVNVPAYRRKAPQGNRYSVGSAIVSRRMARSLGAFGKSGRPRKGVQQVSSGIAYVRAHRRHLKFPARAMFRTGIAERVPQYSAALSLAVTRSWELANKGETGA